MTAANPLVMQVAAHKIGGSPRPMMCRDITTLSNARAVHVANNAAALSLGYTSVLEPGHNWVKYTRTDDPPNVEVTQFFVPCGKMFYRPAHPLTGPGPSFNPIQGPTPVGLGTEIIAVYGQSNADGAGAGRKTAPVPVGGGAGCYAFGDDNLFYTLSDPVGGGNSLKGTDGGPWPRLGIRALGKTLLNGATCNRFVVYAGNVGGTNIDYWANATIFGASASNTVTMAIGSRTFTVPGDRIFPYASNWRATSTSHGPLGGYMDGTVTSYSGTSLTLNVYALGPEPSPGSYNDWVIRPINEGQGYARMRDTLLNMINHGLTPTKIVFAQGEASIGSPRNWADAAINADYWQRGIENVLVAVRAAPNLLTTVPFYIAQTTVCAVRDINSLQANIDFNAALTPDFYVSNFQGQEAIRNRQAFVCNGVTERLGPNLDTIGPAYRSDGCHIGERGLDEASRLYSLSLYGAE